MIKRAVLVIDVQMEYFTGALPISHPTGHLEKILHVFDSAKTAKIPIAVVRHHQPNSDSPIFRRGASEWELHPEIAKRSCDILIDKSLPGVEFAVKSSQLADPVCRPRLAGIPLAGIRAR